MAWIYGALTLHQNLLAPCLVPIESLPFNFGTIVELLLMEVKVLYLESELPEFIVGLELDLVAIEELPLALI